MLVSPVLAWETSILFANAAEGATYTQVVAAMGLDTNREAATAPSTKWLIESAKRGVTVRQGLFFVWPVVPKKTFQYEMATQLATDVTKIGSAGNGASQAIGDWLRRHSGAPIKIRLSRASVYQVEAVLRLAPDVRGVTWESEDGTPYKGAFKSVTERVDVKDMLAQMGSPFARDIAIDLRPMAAELEEKQLAGSFEQTIDAQVPDTAGKWYRLVDDSTGQLIVCGNL